MKNLKTRFLPFIFLLSPAAFASTESDAAFASITTEASDMISSAWPIVVAIVVGSIGMKLFKKFANKAS